MAKTLGILFCLSLLARADPVSNLANGGFETGNLTGWTDAGDTTSLVVGSLEVDPGVPPPLVLPTEGDFFAVVTSGPGEGTQGGLPNTGLLEQAFEIFSPGGIVAFDWNFLTAEFPGDQASILDFFDVTLERAGGPTYSLISGDVSGAVTFYGGINGTLGFSELDPLGVLAPDGSVYIYETGWRGFSFTAGPGNYTLRFRAGDEFDGVGDSALLVDNVRVDPVPEPASLTLLSALAAAGALARRSRNRSRTARPDASK